ncbi:MAG TPA: hypothetical protein DEO40_04195 [Treponema sp.]|nr:hypothetical protein [Treponema sp.]
MREPGLSQKYCHAEFISASALDIVHRFRNEFGMTLGSKLIGHPQVALNYSDIYIIVIRDAFLEE